jgi:hypothetical protein
MNKTPSDRSTFTRTLVSVLAVQVVSLIILAILQARYGG